VQTVGVVVVNVTGNPDDKDVAEPTDVLSGAALFLGDSP
jgi:hypothetical protein